MLHLRNHQKPPWTGKAASYEEFVEVLQISRCEQHPVSTSGSEIPEHKEKRVKFFHVAMGTDRNMYPLSNQKVVNTETVARSQLSDKSVNLYSQA